MDASVNMKMSPDEHRLIRESVETRVEQIHEALRQGEIGAALRSEAREKEARLRQLLAKL